MSLYNDASLVLIPSGYKEGKLYSIKPTDGGGDFTFSRASSATRVNSSGLIEKETQNLLLQSNQFDTTWTTSNASITGGQSGYDGSSDAWLLSKSAAGGRLYQNLSASGILTFSVYMKANASTWALIQIDGSSNDAYAYVDLQNGIIGTTSSSNIIEGIEDIGVGWYRVFVSLNDVATRVRIYPADGNGTVSATSGSIYIQDAQLNQGLVADSYLETTTTAVYGGITDDLPRLDYTDASCPSLLLEPQRTNLVPYSEYANGWATNGTGSITDNAETSPEGYINAFTLNDTSTGTYYRIEENITLSSGNHTFSVFVKKTSGALSHYAGVQLDSSRSYVIIDTTNGTYNEASGTANDNVTIEDFNSDWWRVIITNNITAGSIRIAIWPALSENGTSIQTSATGENSFYGVQLEEGYATSYIPTYGSAVTRVDDACTNFTFNDLQTTDASLFVEFNYTTGKSGDFRFVFNTENSTSGSLDAIQLNSTAGGTSFSFNITGSGVSFSTLSFLSGTNKALIKFERSSGAVKTFLNGTQVDSGTASSIPQIHKISLGARINPFASFNTDREYGDTIKQFLAFPTALTDSEAIALTQV